jgi:hypothetical protein
MRRLLWFSAAVAGLTIATPALGGFTSGPFNNDFEGRVERDATSYFGFDVKVARVTALLKYACTNGEGGGAAARVRGKLPVEDDRFAGTLRRTADFITRGGNPGTIKYRVRGEFQSRRKAKGTVDAEIRFREGTPRGGQRVRCYTGVVQWKARRGVNVEPVGPMRSGS